MPEPTSAHWVPTGMPPFGVPGRLRRVRVDGIRWGQIQPSVAWGHGTKVARSVPPIMWVGTQVPKKRCAQCAASMPVCACDGLVPTVAAVKSSHSGFTRSSTLPCEHCQRPSMATLQISQ